MSNTKKKKQRILIIGAAVVFAAAAVLVYCFVNRDDISQLATATLADIVFDSRIPDKEYSNLDFSNATLNIPDADKFYKIHFTDDELTANEATAYCYELFDLIFDYVKEEYPDIIFADNSGNSLPDGEAELSYDMNNNFFEAEIDCFVDDDTGYQCRFNASGRFIIFDSRTIQVAAIGAGASGTAEEIIHLDRGEKVPGNKYLVDGEEYSPAQALEFAETVMSDRISKFIANNKVSPTELVIIRNPDNGNYFYKIQFEFLYEGTPYFHLSTPTSIEGMGMQYGVIYMTISSPDRVGEIYNMIDHSAIKNDGEYKDKYIPLDAAAEIASEYLAPYYKHKISEVTIKYVNFSDVSNLNSANDIEERLQSDSNTAARTEYLRPCWCFIIDKSDPFSGDYCMTGEAIVVDMQTGEVTTCIGVH